jgi:hypothetical protein
MTSVIAAIRPDSWNFPLLVHAAGAMLLVGSVLTGASLLAFARGRVSMLRLGYLTLLVVGLPALILMRVGAAWIYSKEGWDDVPDDAQPAWLGVGFLVGNLGGLLFLVSLAVGGVGVYRLREGEGAGLLKVTMGISLVLLAAYVVAVWAMAGKPD